ncbi:MAG: RsmF rRNA methyltransferase first C-terminal domain-containing protein, partial [Defluviitaleaceae bacterium]|nr:RsmF rRNA methyltransferase first C-terminal domain-containing protein [Defluviitaleaceae bacterium]
NNFLDTNSGFCLVQIAHEKFGISPANQGLRAGLSLSSAGRIWPHRHDGEGHFMALLQKNGDSSVLHNDTKSAVGDFKNAYYDEFCAKYLKIKPQGQIYAHADNLYMLPKDCPSVAGLDVARIGLHLGSLHKQRFVPSYALAMTLKKPDFTAEHVIDLDPADPRVKGFLGGETFQIDALDGYNLFCVAGYPLGFAKVLAGRVKGHISGR